ncbi:MAG: COX15/CtaA family protein [Acetobacteraceae bacterium]|nr:COX15/CtaA family protein [Acetobacteraceae bacterium]
MRLALPITGQQARPTSRLAAHRAVAAWLFCICFMLLVMISLGGATRLTGSGLSIMEWAPLMGSLPPMSDAEWQRLYALYQQIPQYELINRGFGIEGFKSIFWLEWVHRLWGRLMGAMFIVPLLWFAVRGMISARLAIRLFLLFLLGGLQGAVGWFMVASGFAEGSTAVSAYRLVMHLVLALALYAAILWTALGLWRPRARNPVPRLAGLLWVVCGLVSLTIVAGGFVAGLKAGLIYNTFPLMDGRLIPEGYADLHPFLRNLTENLPAVQFDHRLLASLTAVVTLGVAAYGQRQAPAGARRTALRVLAGVVLLQYGLGVATLLLVVPVALGTLHQAVAILLLTSALITLYLHRPLGDSAAS